MPRHSAGYGMQQWGRGENQVRRQRRLAEEKLVVPNPDAGPQEQASEDEQDDQAIGAK